MDNIRTAAYAGGEMTCAHSCHASGRIYAGAADGTVRAVAANASSDPSSTELLLTQAHWDLRVCAHAVTSICGAEAVEKDKGALLLIGSAGGEIVVLREQLEVRRFQLGNAVQHICYGRSGEFIVGDAQGNLYGVTQYELLWKKQLPAIAPRNDTGPEFFYPTLAQPIVLAIAHTRLLDVEKTLSNYILVTTGQKHLFLIHCGNDFSVIPTRTPIAALTSISAKDEDVVLASGEEGIIYRLVSYRDMVPKDTPDIQFALEVWAQVSFSVMKLVPVNIPFETKLAEFAWICLGANGEAALFRGQESLKQWKISSTCDVKLDFPVDLVIVNKGDDATQQSAAMVFPDRIHTFSIDQQQ